MNDKQFAKDTRYLRMARIWSENSYAIRLKVGCLIVSKDGNIISDGYNGTPRGFENVCETTVDGEDFTDAYTDEGARITLMEHVANGEKIVSKPYVLHAEANAISKLARSTQSSEGATLYCTDMPCVECSKLIIQAGIKRVVYERPYRNVEGLHLLQRAGITVCNITTQAINDLNKENEA